MIGAKELLKYSKNIRVLYAEDDEKLREDTYRLLSTFFQDISVAENGKRALEMYKPGEFDIIISDYVMPELNGIDLALSVKEKSPEQIFIILSAHDEQQYVDELRKAGVDDFIFKPLNIQQFIQVIHKACVQAAEKKA